MDIYRGPSADIPIVNRVLHQPIPGGPHFISDLHPWKSDATPRFRLKNSPIHKLFTQEFPGTKYWGCWCRKKQYICWWNTICLSHYIPLHTITYHYITCMPYIRVEANGRQWCSWPLSQAARGMLRPVPRGANSWNSQVVPPLPPYDQGYQGWKKIGTTRVRNNLHS